MKAKACFRCDGKGITPPGLFTNDKDVGGVCHSCNGSGFDHEHTDELVCPYCGHIERDSWELGESSSDHSCGSCEKRFTFETQTSRTFSSTKADCLNGGEHIYGKPLDFEKYWYKRCQACDHSIREQKIDSTAESK